MYKLNGYEMAAKKLGYYVSLKESLFFLRVLKDYKGKVKTSIETIIHGYTDIHI